jgi:hypothetical protein
MRDGTRKLRRPRRNPWRQSAGALAAALALVAMGSASAQGLAPQQPCAMVLSLEVTPDVPNPSDGGFLSSLLGDHPGYQLSVRRVVDDTHVDLLLYGPGPSSNCQAVVDSMRNDGRVQSLDVRE